MSFDDSLERRRLFGYDFVDCDSLEEVASQILISSKLEDSNSNVVTPNVDILVQLSEHPDTAEAEVYESARFCLPDGQPIVWASRLFGKRLSARLPGSGLFEALWPELCDLAIPAALLVSNDQVAERLRAEHSRVHVKVAPRVDADDFLAINQLIEEFIDEVKVIEPQVILFGLGHPKDARLISALSNQWQAKFGVGAPSCLALGGSFSMYVGLHNRAPAWMQKIGMEWFYRFVQEPRRLFHRYFVRSPRFLKLVVAQWRKK